MLYLVLAGFTALSLAPLPDFIRPAILTTGAFGILTLAGSLTAVQAVTRSWVLLLSVVGITIFWATAFPVAINGIDDNGAYLIFVEAFYNNFDDTIQPLSERRLFSVGGGYAFQAPFMRWLGLQALILAEPILGLLLFATAFLSDRRVPILGTLCAMSVLAFFPALGASVLANTASAFVLGSMTYVLLILAIRIPRNRPIGTACLTMA